ncbi:hypothetical protein CEXT_318461 [Caerostris extrusa]|uniref:Uncharacterized protein n=1 Tax=Caerostris extrusa TaxID=172846 RepID=A0AAV4RQY8_CAEEX|nr:hypothetical protein CEXT_318461 [Caerostris extrusa]
MILFGQQVEIALESDGTKLVGTQTVASGDGDGVEKNLCSTLLDGTLKQQQIDRTCVKIASTGERGNDKWMKQRRRSRIAEMLSCRNIHQSI